MTDQPQGQDDLHAQLTKIRRTGEERAAERLAQKLGHPYADLSKMPISLDAVRVIPEAEARDGKIAAIEVRDKKIATVVVDPTLPATKKAIEDLEAKNFQVKVFVVSPSSLAAGRASGSMTT